MFCPSVLKSDENPANCNLACCKKMQNKSLLFYVAPTVMEAQLRSPSNTSHLQSVQDCSQNEPHDCPLNPGARHGGGRRGHRGPLPGGGGRGRSSAFAQGCVRLWEAGAVAVLVTAGHVRERGGGSQPKAERSFAVYPSSITRFKSVTFCGR